MTRIEKETVINAAAYYRDSQMRRERTARKNGETKKAAEHQAEASKAHAIVCEFCRILAEPCGTCSI